MTMIERGWEATLAGCQEDGRPPAGEPDGTGPIQDDGHDGRGAGTEKLLLKVEDVAEALSVGRNRVYELIYKEQLVSVKIGGSRRVPVSAVRAYVDSAIADAKGLS
jgi:excisionase family DNA binding protein